jgi:hypothetical protein
MVVEEVAARRIVSRLRFVVALGAAVLLGATWKLWTPPSSRESRW